jgi:hypothetical protein
MTDSGVLLSLTQWGRCRDPEFRRRKRCQITDGDVLVSLTQRGDVEIRSSEAGDAAR